MHTFLITLVFAILCNAKKCEREIILDAITLAKIYIYVGLGWSHMRRMEIRKKNRITHTSLTQNNQTVAHYPSG
jgi:hypothetical protein